MFANGLQAECESGRRPAWRRAAGSQRVVLRCSHSSTYVRLGASSENRNFLSTLGLSAGRPGGVLRRRSPSVYGAFPESGCLGCWRFCKFFLQTGHMASRLRQKMGPRARLGLAVLARGQWWRLLGGLRPSGTLVFVCRVDTRNEPEKNQDRQGNDATAGACGDQTNHTFIQPGARRPLEVTRLGNMRRLNHRFSRTDNARRRMRAKGCGR